MNFNIPTEKHISRWPEDLMEGGYTRREIDRSIMIAQGEFYRSHGKGVIQQARAVHERDGYLSVLDAGCGTGYELFELRENLKDLSDIRTVGVSNIDFSDESEMWRVRAANQNGDIDYVVADLQTDAMPAESFNFIISYEVLIHCDDPQAVVDNLAKSLTSGGVLLCNAEAKQAKQLSNLLETLGDEYSYERHKAVSNRASMFADNEPQARDNYRIIRK